MCISFFFHPSQMRKNVTYTTLHNNVPVVLLLACNKGSGSMTFNTGMVEYHCWMDGQPWALLMSERYIATVLLLW